MTSLELALVEAEAIIVGEEARNVGMTEYYQEYISEQAKILEETQRQLTYAQQSVKNLKELLQKESDDSSRLKEHLETLTMSCNKVAGDVLKKKKPLKKELIEALEYVEAITRASAKSRVENARGLNALNFMVCKKPGS